MTDIIVRQAQPQDAVQLIDHVKRLAQETDADIALGPGEFNLTVEDEQKYISGYASSENSIMLVAEHAGKIIGELDCKGGMRMATRHAATLGISVAKEWRGQGVGSLLMERAVEWGETNEVVSRIELYVFARNAVAIHLYEKFGFEVEGRRRRAIFRNGEYHDDLIMAILFDKKS